MATSVLNIPNEVTRTTQECKLSCFYGRKIFRHNLLFSTKSTACEKDLSCKEKLVQVKSALFRLAQGQMVKSIFNGSKQVTFVSDPAVQKSCLEDMRYELECECGQYAKQKRTGGKPSAFPNLCGCGPRCGCGCGSGRAIRGYL